MYKARAYACTSPTAALAGTTIPRRDVTDRDVQIEILFCGICHSDLHQARDEWHDAVPTDLPVRPRPRDRRPGDQGRRRRHEVQGRRRGRRRLPGRVRPHLPELPERPGAVLPERHLHLQLARQARDGPGHLRRLLRQRSWWRRTWSSASRRTSTSPGRPRCCAPASPPTRRSKRNGVGPGKKVGVVGLGGLGHMGVKLAHAMGARVAVFTTSPEQDGGRPAAGGRRGRSCPEDAGRDEASTPARST